MRTWPRQRFPVERSGQVNYTAATAIASKDRTGYACACSALAYSARTNWALTVSATGSNNPRDRLENVCKAMHKSLSRLQEAVSFTTYIGANAQVLNEANHGRLFGSIQNTFARTMLLDAARLLENEDGIPLNNVSGAMNILRSTGVEPDEPRRLVAALRRNGAEGLSDDQPTGDLKRYAQKFLGMRRRPLKKTISTITEIRNRVLAHADASVDADLIPKVTYQALDDVISFLEMFLDVVYYGYLGISPNSGADATRISASLRYLLSDAGIVLLD